MSNDTQKTFQRDTKGDDYSGRQKSDKDSIIGDELKVLIKAGLDDYRVMQQLKNKYSDQKVIDAIFDAYKTRLELITKKARKFRDYIVERYPNLSQQDRILKAKKYASKIPLSDDELSVFINMIMTDKALISSYKSLPNTPMAKMLGYATTTMVTDQLNVQPKEKDTINEIIRLHGQTKGLHSQVVMQALSYRDCAPEALHGSTAWAPYKKNIYSYVHPVVAALFLPKIKLLDENMLIANIGNIVESKAKGLQLMTQPDMELYWNLITDPTHSTCNSDTPANDLYQRYILQTKLWDSVLNLRQGIYYEDRMNDFIVAIDNCKNNIYDAPDLTYVKDEGTILRRLLASFGIRPTLVSVSRLYGLGLLDSFGFANNALSNAGIGELTTVPMITLRLPTNVYTGKQMVVTSLEEALTQPQWFVTNKNIVPKAQTILHSRDVIFFYVGRRFQTINLSRINLPCNFNALPMTVAGWEALNDRCVNFETRMRIMNDDYELRSVVFVERSRNNKNLIIGSSAGIVIPRDIGNEQFEQSFFVYDPQGSSEMFIGKNGQQTRNPPITDVPGQAPFNSGDNTESFYQRASTRGTIFMYQKVTSGPCDDNNIIRFNR